MIYAKISVNWIASRGRILELSRLDIQESPLKFERLNPSDLVNDLLERLKPVMEHKVYAFKRTYRAIHHGWVTGRLFDSPYQTFLDNAAKFTPPKGDIIVKMNSRQGFLGDKRHKLLREAGRRGSDQDLRPLPSDRAVPRPLDQDWA